MTTLNIAEEWQTVTLFCFERTLEKILPLKRYILYPSGLSFRIRDNRIFWDTGYVYLPFLKRYPLLYSLKRTKVLLKHSFFSLFFTHYRTRTDNPVGADFESAVFTYFTK